MDSSVWLIIGLIAGGVTGGVATWAISRARGGAVSVMQLKQENDKFRDEVAEHFVETARLINEMTDSYKKVFDHLSSGAEKLVDDEKLARRLPPTSGQEVRLGGFGSSSAAAAAAAKGADRAKPGPAGSRDAEAGRSASVRGGSRPGTPKPETGAAAGTPEKAASPAKPAASAKAVAGEKTGAGTASSAGDGDPLKRQSGPDAAARGQGAGQSASATTEKPATADKAAKDSEKKETDNKDTRAEDKQTGKTG